MSSTKNLLAKEFRLAMHPTNIIFLSFVAFLLIPNYPYYITFFYTGLALFFTCMNGRENHDIMYSLNLPVAKKDIVKARILFATLMELLQMIICVPLALIRLSYKSADEAGNVVFLSNEAGVNANLTFFALSLMMLGIFNYVFFVNYYKDVNKVGKTYIIASIIEFLFIGAAEFTIHIPKVAEYFNVFGKEHIAARLILFAVGIAVFVLLTFSAYKRSAKEFEVYDI